MTTEGLPSLPHAIYFDANALIRIPHTLRDRSFQKVVEFAKEYGIKLVLPEVAWFEWLHSLAEKLRTCLTRIENDAKYVTSLLGRSVLDYRKPDIEEAVVELFDRHTDRVKAAGFQIAKTPNLETGELLIQAILKQRPFQSGGKGSRDVVIVETAAQHAVEEYEGPRILLISNDKVVQRSSSRFKDRGVDVVICPAEKALDELYASLSEVVKSLRETVKKTHELAEEAALKFLSKHQASVFKFITASEISLDSLESKLKEVRPYGFPNIQRLDAVRPIKVASASPGFPSLGGDLPPGRYPFQFDVEVEFDLTIKYPLGRLLVDRRSIPLDRPVSVDELPRSSAPTRDFESESMTLVCDIRVEATVSAEGARDRSYKDLEMTEVWLWELKKQGYLDPRLAYA